MADPIKIVKISLDDFELLKTQGYIERGGERFDYDTKCVYVLTDGDENIISVGAVADTALNNAAIAHAAAASASAAANAAHAAANTAQETANTAKEAANTAQHTADSANNTAQTANATANAAHDTANAANAAACTAYAAANAANNIAQEGLILASQALTTANTAQATAVTAEATANTAKITAETVAAVADEAKELAEEGKDLADQAKIIAQSISATAQAARDTANVANNTAQAAEEIANAAQVMVGEAKDLANEALDVANTAAETASVAAMTYVTAQYASDSTRWNSEVAQATANVASAVAQVGSAVANAASATANAASAAAGATSAAAEATNAARDATSAVAKIAETVVNEVAKELGEGSPAYNIIKAEADKAANAANNAANASNDASIYKQDARTAANEAGSAASEASVSAGHAYDSASDAANAAANSAISADSSAQAANQARIHAENAANNAINAASNASQAASHASEAETHALAASNAAINAASNATKAQENAEVAENKAEQAAIYAQNASQHAEAAASDACIASSKASEAANQAIEALRQAEIASTQANEAYAQAVTAQGHAQNAANDANNASINASKSSQWAANAANNANNASTSANNASNSANAASITAQAAANSANNAANEANDASNSALNAQEAFFNTVAVARQNKLYQHKISFSGSSLESGPIEGSDRFTGKSLYCSKNRGGVYNEIPLFSVYSLGKIANYIKTQFPGSSRWYINVDLILETNGKEPITTFNEIYNEILKNRSADQIPVQGVVFISYSGQQYVDDYQLVTFIITHIRVRRANPGMFYFVGYNSFQPRLDLDPDNWTSLNYANTAFYKDVQTQNNCLNESLIEDVVIDLQPNLNIVGNPVVSSYGHGLGNDFYTTKVSIKNNESLDLKTQVNLNYDVVDTEGLSTSQTQIIQAGQTREFVFEDDIYGDEFLHAKAEIKYVAGNNMPLSEAVTCMPISNYPPEILNYTISQDTSNLVTNFSATFRQNKNINKYKIAISGTYDFIDYADNSEITNQTFSKLINWSGTNTEQTEWLFSTPTSRESASSTLLRNVHINYCAYVDDNNNWLSAGYDIVSTFPALPKSSLSIKSAISSFVSGEIDLTFQSNLGATTDIGTLYYYDKNDLSYRLNMQNITFIKGQINSLTITGLTSNHTYVFWIYQAGKLPSNVQIVNCR